MRIFLSCQQALRPHAVPAYAFWEYYFKSALTEAGHQILETPEADWAEGITSLSKKERAAWLERTWTRTIDYLRAEHRRVPVDLFLSYLFPNQVEPTAVRTISEEGIPTVNFFCDNMREFVRVPAPFDAFDLHWVPEAEARPMYLSAGAPFVYAPMPMWVRAGYRDIPGTETGGAVFLGSHDELREDLLGEAVGLGLEVEIYGAGWRDTFHPRAAHRRRGFRTLVNQVDFLRREGLRGMAMRATYKSRKRRPGQWIEKHARPALSSDSYFSTIRGARVVVGINRCPTFRRSFSNPLRYSRLRDIEAPMLGACYLTEWAPGLEDLYDVGTEIEAYRDASELVEKSRALEHDPARRARLRERGQRRALADHTIARSLDRIVEKLGISG
jgi:hypothetical protein